MRPAAFDIALLAALAVLVLAGLAVYGVSTPHGHGLRCRYGADPARHTCAKSP